MADAGGLHCPNCGAAAEPQAGRCPYCQARLATVSCPSCFALMFEGAVFCSACGARRERAAQEGEQAACPGCGGELAGVAVGSTSLLECSACDGVWLDRDVFERLRADREAQAAVLHRPPRDASDGGRPAPVRYRPCARCGTLMNRVNFGRISGAVIDVCQSHGTFLDAGELRQIIQFIHDGGLDRARARQIEELREEQARLRTLEARANAARGRANPEHALGLRRGSWDGAAIADLVKFFSRSG
jgi:Zn-finger nucleic acid-binding protein